MAPLLRTPHFPNESKHCAAGPADKSRSGRPEQHCQLFRRLTIEIARGLIILPQVFREVQKKNGAHQQQDGENQPQSEASELHAQERRSVLLLAFTSRTTGPETESVTPRPWPRSSSLSRKVSSVETMCGRAPAMDS